MGSLNPGIVSKNAVNVLNFAGVDPTGATSSQTAFNNAVNTAVAAALPLYIPAGMYLASILWPATIPCAIFGDGMLNTFIYQKGGTTAGCIQVAGGLGTHVIGNYYNISNAPGGFIRGMTVTSNTGPGLCYNQANNMELYDFFAYGAGANFACLDVWGGSQCRYFGPRIGAENLALPANVTAFLNAGATNPAYALRIAPGIDTATGLISAAINRTQTTEHYFIAPRIGHSGATVAVMALQNQDAAIYTGRIQIVGGTSKIATGQVGQLLDGFIYSPTNHDTENVTATDDTIRITGTYGGGAGISMLDSAQSIFGGRIKTTEANGNAIRVILSGGVIQSLNVTNSLTQLHVDGTNVGTDPGTISALYTSATNFHWNPANRIGTDWNAYVPSVAADVGSFGALTVNVAQYKIVGKTLIIQLNVSANVTAGAPTEFRIGYPAGVNALAATQENGALITNNSIQEFGTMTFNAGYIRFSRLAFAAFVANAAATAEVNIQIQ